MQIGILGLQTHLTVISLKKSNLYKKLKRGTEEWDFYFLKYIPADNIIKCKHSKTLKNSNTLKNENKSKNKIFALLSGWA